MKQEKTAWYLDEDVLLEGIVKKNRFYADSNICGFGIQEFTEDMIDKDLFFDLETAISVCGEIPIINVNPNKT